MKILYGIQGTGNGHLTRAMEIIPYLQKIGDVDILISGLHHDLELPFKIKYKFKGFGFFFGKNGGINWLQTVKKYKFAQFLNELNQVPVHRYDVVLSDFEPMTAWACKLKEIKCLGISHQSAMLSSKTPKPNNKEYLGETILKHYAPVSEYLGFHFSTYDQNIYTPILRKSILEAEPKEKGYYTAYLPAYSDEKTIKVLQAVKGTKWRVFSKHSKTAYQEGDIKIFPVQNELFTKSLINAKGVLCGAGFETPAEALHMNKRIMVVPMKGQYEQKCNAEALKQMKVPVIKKLSMKKVENIQKWTESEVKYKKIHYPDIAENIANLAVKQYLN